MKQTPLHAAHLSLKAKMAEFAGYDMPIQYPEGVMAEHNWTRAHTGVFDVSHMGQLLIEGAGAGLFLETLTPGAIADLGPGVAKYSVLMNENGGMVDDLIITCVAAGKYFVVVNGACKEKDIEWMRTRLPAGVTLTHLVNRGLIAIQGPSAEKVLREALGIDASDLSYMRYMEKDGLFISRLGYTGEDGFEISMPDAQCRTLWDKILANPEARPVGLAARDSLRLEMGYPLYGHDIDATTTPLEADLGWVMRKTNTDYIGRDKVTEPKRKRVGIKLIDKGVAREGCEIFGPDGKQIGIMTSGGFSPTLQASIGMGYVESQYAVPGTKISVIVRGRDIAAEIASLPFVQARTKKQNKKAA